MIRSWAAFQRPISVSPVRAQLCKCRYLRIDAIDLWLGPLLRDVARSAECSGDLVQRLCLQLGQGCNICLNTDLRQNWADVP